VFFFIAADLQHYRVTVLSKHEAIMKFPSEQFYGGKLTIGNSSQEMPSTLELWPSGGDQPIMFVNVVGIEKTLTVATQEGSEKSKCNDEEIKVVVSVID
jgi:superfamily I DNA and/or RNA helicase